MATYSNLTEDTPGKDSLQVPGAGSQPSRKLSLPYSEQRRKMSYGVYSRTVLCAVDPSEHSKDAFNWYLANVWKADDLIIIVYCPEPPNIPSFSFKSGFRPPTEKWTELVLDMNAKAQKLEEEYETECISKKLRYKIRGESFKNAGEGICRIAEDEKADLIVLGSRGIGAVKRMLIGSVSEYVVRNASIPCCIIPSFNK